MRLGLDNVTALKVGAVNANRVYFGNTLVWEGGATPPPAGWMLYDDGTPLIGANTFGFASIVYLAGTYYAYVHGSDNKIDRYTSIDGITFTHTGEVLAASQAWEGGMVGVPQVWKESGAWYMLYRGRVNNFQDRTGLATSSDGITWTKHAGNPVLTWGTSGSWDADGAEATSPIKVGDTYYVYYEGGVGMGRQLGVATSTDLITWTKDPRNPIISSGVFCPFVWVFSGVYYMLLPRYTNVVNAPSRGVLDLYRCPRPTFYPEEREYLGVIYDSDENSPLLTLPDTPWIVQSDITNQDKIQAGLKVYFATGKTGHDGLYLLEHGDTEAALDLLDGIAFLHISDEDWVSGALTSTQVIEHNVVLAPGDNLIAEQPTYSDNNVHIGADTFDEWGQTFTAPSGTDSASIEVNIVMVSAPIGRLKMLLYDQDLYNVSPQGSVAPIASALRDVTTSGWHRFDFPGVALTNAQKYTFTLMAEVEEGADRWDVGRASFGTAYTGGDQTYWQVGTNKYTRSTSHDLQFRLHAGNFPAAGTFESDEIDLSPAGTAGPETRIRWVAITDIDATVTVEVAISTDAGSNYGSYSVVANGGSIPGITQGTTLADYRLKYKASLATTDAGKTPILQRVLLEVQSQ